jgi:hypothetical protein
MLRTSSSRTSSSSCPQSGTSSYRHLCCNYSAWIVGGVELLPLGTVGDKVSGVIALEAAPRRSPPLLAELVQGAELSCQQGDLIVWDALVLLIKSYDQRRQSKLQHR